MSLSSFRVFRFSMLLLALLSLIACGGDDEGDDGSDASQNPKHLLEPVQSALAHPTGTSTPSR